MNRIMRRGLIGLVALGFGVVVGIAHGQNYPDKPIHLVVPAAAGGGTDYTARLIGQKLSEALGQAVVVENRGSAASNIGTALWHAVRLAVSPGQDRQTRFAHALTSTTHRVRVHDREPTYIPRPVANAP